MFTTKTNCCCLSELLVPLLVLAHLALCEPLIALQALSPLRCDLPQLHQAVQAVLRAGKIIMSVSRVSFHSRLKYMHIYIHTCTRKHEHTGIKLGDPNV